MFEITAVGVAQVDKFGKARLKHKSINPSWPNDQDAWLAKWRDGIFAIADGIASTPRADRASRAACQAFYDELINPEKPKTFIDVQSRIMHGDLLTKVHLAALATRAATTFTGVMVTSDNALTYAHVGDTRLFLRRDDELHTVTSDQVVAGERKNILFNYLGDCGRASDHERTVELSEEPNTPARYLIPEAQWGSMTIQSGDRFCLVSDGVTGDSSTEIPTKEELLRRTSLKLGAQACAEALVEYSLKIDDTTAVVFDIG